MPSNTTPLSSLVLFPSDVSQSLGTAILFHGMTGAPIEMLSLGEALVQHNYTVYIPLLPGHGTNIEEMHHVSLNTFLSHARSVLMPQSCGKEPIFLAGLSFGSLLALYLAQEFPARVTACAIISCPLRFNSRIRELLLNFFSVFPDCCLNHLWIQQKKRPTPAQFILPRFAYSQHSAAGGGRLVKLRRGIFKNARQLNCPILALHDPRDHHLSRKGIARLQKLASQFVNSLEFLGAGHEMTVGPRYKEVNEEVVKFFLNNGLPHAT